MRDVLKVISAVCGLLLVLCVIGLILTIRADTQSLGEAFRSGLAWVVGLVASAGFGGWAWSQVIELTPPERLGGHTFDDGGDGYERVEPPRGTPPPRPDTGPRATYRYDPDD